MTSTSHRSQGTRPGQTLRNCLQSTGPWRGPVSPSARGCSGGGVLLETAAGSRTPGNTPLRTPRLATLQYYYLTNTPIVFFKILLKHIKNIVK